MCNFEGEESNQKIVDRFIEDLLESLDPEIRAKAVYALSYQDYNPRAQMAVVRALDDKEVEVVIVAISRLKRMKTNHLDPGLAKTKLSAMFGDHDVDVRINALDAYGILAEAPSAHEKVRLVNLLKNDGILVRKYAVEVLGKLKVRSALDELKQMVKDEKSATPFASAVWAVRQIEPDFPRCFEEDLWKRILVPALSGDDLGWVNMAVEVLRKIGSEVSLPHLKALRSDYQRSRDVSEINYAIWDIEERLDLPRSL